MNFISTYFSGLTLLPQTLFGTGSLSANALSLWGVLVLLYRLRIPKLALLTAKPTPATALSQGIGTLPAGSPNGPEFENERETPGKELAIIIPARNEELRLRPCLESLKAVPAAWNVIVVDDGSEDQTAELARTFAGVKVISLKKSVATPLQYESGKSWACQIGAEAALDFKWILFTDADTVHNPAALQIALKHVAQNKMDLVSSLPFYLTPTLWEKVLAPFYAWITLITNAFRAPQLNRLYANGQFLLFNTRSYHELGGHRAVVNHLAEDIIFARRVITERMRFGVLNPPAYAVRMYQTPREFYLGWRRLYQIGFEFSSLATSFELIAVMSALTAALHPTAFSVGLTSLSFFLLWSSSRKLGQFPIWTFLLSPLTLPLFLILSADAALRRVSKQTIQWRARSYRAGPNGAKKLF